MKKAKERLLAVLAALCVLMAALPLCTQAEVGDIVASTAEGDVIEGKDGWLFYTGDDTIRDFLGTDLFSGAQLDKIEKKFGEVRDRLAAEGTEFVIFIAPNKEQLYAQYMPDSYGPLTFYTRAQQVTEYLRSCGLRVVYPILELQEAVAQYPQYDFYLRSDTHWNNLGAYVGTGALLRELGIELPALSQVSVRETSSGVTDLSAAAGLEVPDVNYEVSGYASGGVPTVRQYADEILHSTNTGADGRSVLFVGDSFSTAMMPYLAAEFDDVTRIPSKSLYQSLYWEQEHPDVLIYETVERYVFLMESGFGLPE